MPASTRATVHAADEPRALGEPRKACTERASCARSRIAAAAVERRSRHDEEDRLKIQVDVLNELRWDLRVKETSIGVLVHDGNRHARRDGR